MGMTWATTYVKYLYEHFMEFSWTIKVAAISVTFSLGLILFTIFRMLLRTWKLRRWKKVYKKLDNRYGDAIRYILSAEANQNMSRQDVIKVLELDKIENSKNSKLKNFKEKMSFARLLYKSRISEEASLENRNLHTIVDIFGMQTFLENLVNKGGMKRQAEALLILRACKLTINPWIANQLRTSKRFRLRRLAVYASIMTGSNSDLEYFESEFFDENCCIYDEIELGYVIQRRIAMKRKIPNLANLALVQKNALTQAVFVRLMRHFNQREYCSELEELFHRDSDKELIQEICRTWGYLKYVESEHLLQDVLITQPDDTKVTIMHALERMGTGKSLDTFVDSFRNSGNEHVRYEALRCLYNYGPAGKSKFYEMKLHAEDKDKKLFEFFTNELLKDDIEIKQTDIYEQQEENIFSVV